MACCILEKQITTTVIPGSPGTPATPGSPAIPARCYTHSVYTCEWLPTPGLTYGTVFTCNPLPCGMQYATLLNGVVVPPNTVAPFTWVCQTNDVTVCTPAQPAIPGSPGSPPKPAQIITSKNLGWNSHSRAISPLAVDTLFTFTVKNGVRGVFVGVGEAGLDGMPIRTFEFGLMIDGTGVHVRENGVSVHQLAVFYTKNTVFQIERNSLGQIIYRADTSEYVSASGDPGGVLYPYVYMYSGGDRVMCAGYTSLAENANKLRVDTYVPAFEGLLGEGAYEIIKAYALPMTAEMDCSIVEVISINFELPSLSVGMGEGNYSTILAYAPAFTSAMEEAEYVPPVQTEIYGNLQPISGYLFCELVEVCNVSTEIPALAMSMGEGDYSVIGAIGKAPIAFLFEGNRLEMNAVTAAISYSDMSFVSDTLMVLMSNGELESVYTDQIEVIMDMVAEMVGSSVYSLLGIYNMSSMSRLFVLSANVQNTGGAALDEAGRVWVVNTESAATTQYENYGFNSFFVRDGVSYGVADDGIYKLSGADDAGVQISAELNFGKNRLGSSRDKRVPAVYVNCLSEDKMVIKVEVDEQEPYYYEARSSSAELDNHRVDTARGLKGANWTFTLLNQSGSDFEIESLEFTPVEMPRRI